MAKTTQSKKTEWFGMKVSPEEKRKIKDLAKRRRMSQSELILSLVEQNFVEQNELSEGNQLFDLIGEFIGVGEGPPDASTNSKYFDEYGK